MEPNKKVLSLRWKLFSLVGISLLITSELQNKALLPGLTCFFGISPKNLPYFWNTKMPYSFHIPSYFLIFSLNWPSLTIHQCPFSPNNILNIKWKKDFSILTHHIFPYMRKIITTRLICSFDFFTFNSIPRYLFNAG